MSNHGYTKAASESPEVARGRMCHVTADVRICVCFSVSVGGNGRQRDSR